MTYDLGAIAARSGSGSIAEEEELNDVGEGAVSDPRAAHRGLLGRILHRLSESLSIQAYALGFALLATSLFLNQAELAPNLSDLDMWDEAYWIASGRSVLEGAIQSVGGSPFVSVFYALASLPYLSSPFWLVLTASLGRVILVCLLWLSAIRIARHLSTWAPAPILLGMFLVTPMATSILRNPTDALYSALAGLALAEVLAYRSTQDTRHAWGSSIFLGLAALARNDGLLVAVVLVPLLQILAPRTKRLSTLIASVLPVVLLVGGVVLVHGLQSGSYSLGTLERTYGNFESGQQIVYTGTGVRNATMESRLEARRLFGTPQENGFSVLTAIRRNPSEFLRRLAALIPTLPSLYLDAYGKRFGVLLLVLAVTGITVLLRRKKVQLLMILAAFTLPILSGFVITLIRPGHLELWWFSLYALAAIGLHSMFESLRSDRALVVWSAVWGAIALYGLVDDKLGFYYAATVMLGVVWIGSLIVRRHWLPSAAAFAAVALAGGLVIRGGFLHR